MESNSSTLIDILLIKIRALLHNDQLVKSLAVLINFTIIFPDF